MSTYQYSTEAERRQAKQDHEFFWGFIQKDEKILSQLPPGAAEPGTILQFLQQGDLSDESLAAFNPEALKIVQSLRQQKQKKEALVLSEWHAEWLDFEQEQQHWVKPKGYHQSLLIQPAHVNLSTHESTAKSAVLNYWGEDDEAPPGAIMQKARWAKEARATMRGMNLNMQVSVATEPLHSQDTTLFQQISEKTYDPSKQMQEDPQQQFSIAHIRGTARYPPAY